MRIGNKFLAIGLLLVTGFASGELTDDKAAARSFFTRYIELSDAFDEKVVELYSDNAIIRSFRRYPDGQDRLIELSGKQWKLLIAKMMSAAKAQGDLNIFSNIEISIMEKQTKVRANRYSVRKCYMDTGYFMVIERQSNGSFAITEEYSETQPQSNC